MGTLCAQGHSLDIFVPSASCVHHVYRRAVICQGSQIAGRPLTIHSSRRHFAARLNSGVRCAGESAMAFRESNIHAQARAVTGAAIAFVVLNVSLYLADLIIGRLVSGETLFGIVITISVISIIAIEYVNTYVLQELNFRTFFFLI